MYNVLPTTMPSLNGRWVEVAARLTALRCCAGQEIAASSQKVMRHVTFKFVSLISQLLSLDIPKLLCRLMLARAFLKDA
jgi:hypothetical protein